TLDVFPNGIPDQIGLPLMTLSKYATWQNPFPQPMSQVELPFIDDGWHLLRLTFRGNEILAGFDGSPMIDITDQGFGGVAAYPGGGIGAHLFTSVSVSDIGWSNLLVTVAPVAGSGSYTAIENLSLAVPAPGVLGNAAAGLGTNLSAALRNGPAHGTLSLSTNGGFSYLPATNY